MNSIGSVIDLIPLMGNTYPEIQDKKEHIKNTLKREEELFRNTLEKGLIKFDDFTSRSNKTLAGSDVFKLYDTYGFPIDLTKLLCETDYVQAFSRAGAVVILFSFFFP